MLDLVEADFLVNMEVQGGSMERPRFLGRKFGFILSFVSKPRLSKLDTGNKHRGTEV